MLQITDKGLGFCDVFSDETQHLFFGVSITNKKTGEERSADIKEITNTKAFVTKIDKKYHILLRGNKLIKLDTIDWYNDWWKVQHTWPVMSDVPALEYNHYNTPVEFEYLTLPRIYFQLKLARWGLEETRSE